MSRGFIILLQFGVLVSAMAAAAPAVRAAGEGTLIVLNKSDATASLIDLGSGRIVATVRTGTAPHEVDVSPDGRLAVASNYGTREAAGSTLTVIDVPRARVVKTISLGEYRRPHGITWLADGKHVIVTVEENHAVLTVDVDAGKVVAAIKTDQEISHMVVVTPDGGRAFVANIGSGSVSVLDMKKGELIRNIPTGDGAEGIAMTPDGGQVWVTNRAADTVTVIDSRSLEVLGRLASKSFPIRAKVTPDGKSVLVSNARTGDLAVFDVQSRAERRRVPMQMEASGTEGRLFGSTFGKSSVPIGILIRPDGKRAYVAHTNADQVSVVDLEHWKTIGRLKAGKEPDGLGYSPLSVKVGKGR